MRTLNRALPLLAFAATSALLCALLVPLVAVADAPAAQEIAEVSQETSAERAEDLFPSETPMNVAPALQTPAFPEPGSRITPDPIGIWGYCSHDCSRCENDEDCYNGGGPSGCFASVRYC